MKLFIILLLALYTYADVYTCPYKLVSPISCTNDATCTSIYANARCVSGTCQSLTRPCSTDRICFREYDGYYNCKVPAGGSCSSDSVCVTGNKCISGTCNCVNVPDPSTTGCSVVPGQAPCPTGRQCVPNYPDVFGQCYSVENGPCNNDGDCMSGYYCNNCVCKSSSNIPPCKSLTEVQNTMISFASCMSNYSPPGSYACPSFLSVSQCCSLGANVCGSILQNLNNRPGLDVGSLVANDISSNTHTNTDCDYKTYIGARCNIPVFYI